MRFLALSLICLFLIMPLSNTPIISEDDENWLFDYIDMDPNSAYFYAANLSAIASNVSISGYSYRSAGSLGEYYSHLYIKDLLTSFGLNIKIEEFNFINWNIYDKPNMTLTIGGDSKVVDIYPTHFTFGTGVNGVSGEIVYLPLPLYFSEEPLPDDIKEIWDSTSISNKIVLIGREVMFNGFWFSDFYSKVCTEKPKAVLYTWATVDYRDYPFYFSSTGGRRVSMYRDYEIPVAWIEKSIANEIIEALESSINVNATIRIPIEESTGKVRNIVAWLPGKDTSKTLLVTAHYDSVMTPALCDNGAGVAGVLELAWAFSKAVKDGIYTPPINITFIFFTSEEAGLVGSAKYIEMHKNELYKIVGVINLDTLGSFNLEVSFDPVGFFPPNATSPIHIHDIVVEASNELGLDVDIFEDHLHSDDSSFAYPVETNDLINFWWPSFSIDIRDVQSKPAVMIGSAPYFVWEKDEQGRFGLIHTLYDNITSTTTYDWVNPNRLELQIKVAGLSILKILNYFEIEEEEEEPTQPTPPTNETEEKPGPEEEHPMEKYLLPIAITVTIIAIIAIGYIMYTRKRGV